jgi:hypothetical protein
LTPLFRERENFLPRAAQESFASTILSSYIGKEKDSFHLIFIIKQKFKVNKMTKKKQNTDKSYYNKEEKIKILKSYLNQLFVPPNKISLQKYQHMKSQLSHLEHPLTKLIVSKKPDVLKTSAAIILTKALKFPQWEMIDIDTLMNLWLGYDVGTFTKDTIKTIDTLVILSFGSSFFKNTKGLFESVVQKRQFDGLSTIVLTTEKDKNISAVFEKEDIIEFKGAK